MTDNTELKRLADELIAANDLFNESPQDNEVGDAWSLANDRFTEAASPEFILALIAENERLQGCEDVLRQLASHVGAGGYNAPEVDPETFARKIMDGINILNDPMAQLVIKKGEQIDQLRAEVAGFKTGYEAYERVNAELKAELAAEIQRRFDGNEIAARERDEEVRKLKAENEALRKDAERYRWLRDSGQYDWDVSYGKLELRIATPHDDSSDLDACIDAALGQGEQP